MSEKINTDHFSTMEDLLKHLKEWERDDDIDAYYRFFSPSCAYELANKIERQQKEIEEYQKCFEDIERHQKNQMQMQKNLWKRLKGDNTNEWFKWNGNGLYKISQWCV